MVFTKKKTNKQYADLSSKEQEKIMKKVIEEANREQRLLVEEYDKKFGSVKQCKCN